MGQTSLQILNRAGSKSFWNSSWDSKYLYQDFFFKFLIFEKIIHSIINKKSYADSILGLTFKTKNNIYIFKNMKNKITTDDDDIEAYNEDICKSKLWVFKYHNWVVLSVFILMPYKNHKLVEKDTIPAEHQIKKKKFKFISLERRGIVAVNAYKNRVAKATVKLRKKSTIKSTRTIKSKNKVKKRKRRSFTKSIKYNLTLFEKNAKPNSSKKGHDTFKKPIVKKIAPKPFLKKNLKQLTRCAKKKIKDNYDLIKRVFLKKPTKRKLNKNSERVNFKKKITEKKQILSFKITKKKKFNARIMSRHIRSYMSMHADFLKWFSLSMSNSLNRQFRKLTPAAVFFSKKKFYKKIFSTQIISKTYKMLVSKNDSSNIDILLKKISFKKNFLKKKIDFFKTNKKSAMKVNKRAVFEKPHMLTLNIKLNMLLLQPKYKSIMVKKDKRKNSFKRLHKVFLKKKIQNEESKALLIQGINSAQELYDYL